MIKYLKHHEINKTRWDAAIDGAFNGIVYGKSWYLDIVNPDWEALVSNDYEAVMPLTWRKKYGVYYLYQPFFTQQLGVFFNHHSDGTAELAPFLSSLPEKFKFIEVQLNHQNSNSGSELSTVNFQLSTSKKITHHLNLNQPYEIIKSGYSENLRRNLKRAFQSNLQLTDNFKTDELISLFRSTKGDSLKELKDSDYGMFEQLMAAASKRNLLTRSAAIADGKMIAAAVFLKSNHEYIFLFSATNMKAKETGAMSYIIDKFIQQHCGEQIKLDFEGSMDAGVSYFYHSFGADEIVYLQIRKNRLPILLRWLK